MPYGGGGSGGGTIGAVLSHVNAAATLTITTGTEPAPETFVTAAPIVFDGSTSIAVWFYTPAMSITFGQSVVANLWDDPGSGAVDRGRIANVSAIGATGPSGSNVAPALVMIPITPTQATHTYSIRCWKSSGTASVISGAGGVGTYMPGYIRITKA